MNDRSFRKRRAGSAIVAILSAMFVGVIIYLSGIDGRNSDGRGATLQGRIDSLFEPVISIAAKPAQWWRSVTGSWRDHLDTVERLREAEKQLQEIGLLQRKNKILEARLARYEDALKVRSDEMGQTISAWTITDTQGPFKRAKLVSAGWEDGVGADFVALTHLGLVGRVTHLGKNTSRILLLTDYQSRVPVALERDYSSAILVGDGEAMPKLNFLLSKANVEVGDRVLTSGDGGVFPRGIPIGETRMDKDGSWRVYLYHKLGPTDLLQLVGIRRMTDQPENIDVASVDPEDIVSAINGNGDDLAQPIAEDSRQPREGSNSAVIAAELIHIAKTEISPANNVSTRPLDRVKHTNPPDSLWITHSNGQE